MAITSLSNATIESFFATADFAAVPRHFARARADMRAHARQKAARAISRHITIGQYAQVSRRAAPPGAGRVMSRYYDRKAKMTAADITC